MLKPKLVVVSLVGVLALTCVYGVSVVAEQKDQLSAQLQQQLSVALDSQAILQQRLALLSLEQDTSLAEIASLKQSLSERNAENSDLNQELMVYRKIMAPEQQAGGLKIEQLHIEPTLSPGYFRVQLLLMQVSRNKRWLSGEVELVVVGSQDQLPNQYSLADLQTTPEPLSFKFRYFQELNTEIKLPVGFLAERVELKAKLKGDRWNKAAEILYQENWPSLGNT
ncbi:DUF6776 family protein [Agarivorans sp. Z349TD_8]|uniref:DUF6776 family protein n=1 Tax=Agarivorans sp. Z349TD_8 TaxID=3421434 RepID=UPI003D7E9AA7